MRKSSCAISGAGSLGWARRCTTIHRAARDRPPVRNRILSELSAAGPLRAADISRRLGVPANQASFHLRQLAKYELVEEAVGEGRDRRDRVWRLVDRGDRFRTLDMLEQPGGRRPTRCSAQAVGWGHHLVDTAYAGARSAGVQDRSEGTLRLTAEESAQLTGEL